MVRVTSDTDGGAGILMNSPDLTALQLHVHIHTSHDLGAVVSSLLFLGDNGSMRTRAAAEDSRALESRAEVEDHSPNGNEMNRQTVSPEDSLSGKDTRIDDTTHAVE